MAIADTINSMKTNITNAYNAIQTKGGTIPTNKNLENLSTAINSITTTSKPEQEKTTDLSMLNGNQIISPDSGKVLSKVTITKPATLTPENIKKDTNIGGVVGTLEGAKPEQQKTVWATNSRQTILPNNGKTLSKVIIEAAPLPSVNNPTYQNINKCLIDKIKKILILGCNDSFIPSDGSVTSIGDDAFWGCIGLTNVTIPNSVTSIGNSAFYVCSELTSITIPDSVISIGDYAFSDCSGLTNITIGNSVTNINSNAFSDCTCLTSIIIPDSVTSIGNGAFEDCRSLTSVTIPNSVTSIGFSAFIGCSKLTSVTIGNSLTSIGNYAFYNTAYYNDENNWENGVLYIGKHLIKAKTDLSNTYTIKDVTLTIANSAFKDCISLTSVTIPDSVTNIGDSAFNQCTNLKQLILFPTAPPTLGSTNAIPDNVQSIYVQQSSKAAYQAATNWTKFASKIVSDNIYLSFVRFNQKNKEYIDGKVAELSTEIAPILSDYVDDALLGG